MTENKPYFEATGTAPTQSKMATVQIVLPAKVRTSLGCWTDGLIWLSLDTDTIGALSTFAVSNEVLVGGDTNVAQVVMPSPAPVSLLRTRHEMGLATGPLSEAAALIMTPSLNGCYAEETSSASISFYLNPKSDGAPQASISFSITTLAKVDTEQNGARTQTPEVLTATSDLISLPGFLAAARENLSFAFVTPEWYPSVTLALADHRSRERLGSTRLDGIVNCTLSSGAGMKIIASVFATALPKIDKDPFHTGKLIAEFRDAFVDGNWIRIISVNEYDKRRFAKLYLNALIRNKDDVTWRFIRRNTVDLPPWYSPRSGLPTALHLALSRVIEFLSPNCNTADEQSSIVDEDVYADGLTTLALEAGAFEAMLMRAEMLLSHTVARTDPFDAAGGWETLECLRWQRKDYYGRENEDMDTHT